MAEVVISWQRRTKERLKLLQVSVSKAQNDLVSSLSLDCGVHHGYTRWLSVDVHSETFSKQLLSSKIWKISLACYSWVDRRIWSVYWWRQLERGESRKMTNNFLKHNQIWRKRSLETPILFFFWNNRVVISFNTLEDWRVRHDHNSSMQRLKDEENHAVQPIKIKKNDRNIIWKVRRCFGTIKITCFSYQMKNGWLSVDTL